MGALASATALVWAKVAPVALDLRDDTPYVQWFMDEGLPLPRGYYVLRTPLNLSGRLVNIQKSYFDLYAVQYFPDDMQHGSQVWFNYFMNKIPQGGVTFANVLNIGD